MELPRGPASAEAGAKKSIRFMAFTLDSVVPWGRSFEEYSSMFALSDRDRNGMLLGCADGPASFNAEATRQNMAVVSCDPLYRYSAEQIRRRIGATCHEVIEQARQNHAQFIWDRFRSLKELARARMQAMEMFLDDFPAGLDERRYVNAELPSLPFPSRSFDIALCSHFLFLYSDQLDTQFHCDAVLELARVAKEVRIFPLIALGGEPSKHIDAVLDGVRSHGLSASIERVPYEFVRGANEMMRVRTS
jgi:hypothetical protein